MAERTILHSDMNSFYASVEMMLDPSLRGKAVAVCGATEDRHGIVLAKSELAKKAGVKTGMVNWEAKQKCPDIIFVRPQYDQYLKYSKLAHEIYYRYTDLVEPFGMDECWLDVTASRRIKGDGMTIAEEIRESMREELGLTVSVGISFNKIFAKLGSDMKKPDATTEITRDNFRDKIWPLPADEMIYVGRATIKKLNQRGIYTIGDLANFDPELLRHTLGKNGEMIWQFANGLDISRVCHKDFVSPVKSLGHGITCNADLINNREVWKVMYELSQDIGHKLRMHELLAYGVQISIRSSELWGNQYQTQLRLPTRSSQELAEAGFELFTERFDWKTPIRAVCVRAINLVSDKSPYQPDLLTDIGKIERRDRLETCIEDIRRRFGKTAIRAASLMGNLKMPGDGREEVIMPGLMYQ